jgi:hypothetical protein
MWSAGIPSAGFNPFSVVETPNAAWFLYYCIARPWERRRSQGLARTINRTIMHHSNKNYVALGEMLVRLGAFQYPAKSAARRR